MPHSRHTTILKEEILSVPELELLAESDEAGVFAVSTAGGQQGVRYRACGIGCDNPAGGILQR